MEEKLRIGILGGGDIAWKAYFPMLVKWPGIEIRTVYSRTQETIDKIGNHFNIDPRTTSVDGVIDSGVQAALVLTHTVSHYEICRHLLLSGVDVYVEKPATTSSQKTKELADLAKEHKRIFMVGFNRRFSLFYKQGKEIFGNRKLRMCVVEKHRPGTKPRDLFQTYLDDTIHQIDLLRFFCGEVNADYTGYTMEDSKLRSAVSIGATGSGGLAIVQTSRQAGMWQERVTLHGDDMTVEISAFRQLKVKYKDHEEVYGAERSGIWMPQLEERGFHGEVGHFF
ncbi:MAG: Gfo/Idh/MocA family oxidoreductase, partial [Anaerolineales bacterium]